MNIVIWAIGITLSLLAMILIYRWKNRKVVVSNNDLVMDIYRKMSFSEFITPELASLKAVEVSKNYLVNLLGETFKQGLDAVRAINDRKYLLAEYPKHIIDKLDLGTATEVIKNNGEKILVARDAKTGKFLAHAKEVGSSSDLGKLASIGSLIVGSAHIIAGYDNAKKLQTISIDTSKILTNRKNDMLSELEAIFESFQEINSDKLVVDRSFLKDLKLKTKTLRNQWFLDVFLALENLEDPNKQLWLKKLFTSKKSTQSKYGLAEEICLSPLHAIRSSLELERALSIILDEEEVFLDLTVQNQKKKVEELKLLLDEKRQAITKFTGLDVNFLNNVSDETDRYLLSIEEGTRNSYEIHSITEKKSKLNVA